MPEISYNQLTKMPNIRIKSSQRRLLILLAFTFLVGTMITIVNYNQNFAQQRFILSDNDRTALLNYFKYTHLKKNLISDEQVNFNKNQLASSSHRKLASQISQINQPSSINNLSEQSIVKLSSTTTFSESKEASPNRNLINRDNRDVIDSNHVNKELNNKSVKLKDNQANDKLINSNLNLKKPITPAPIQDKIVNLTSTGQQLANSEQASNKQNLILSKSSSVYVHSETELSLTQKFIIDKKNFCSKEHGFGLDLLVMVITSPSNFDARQAIRQTWGGFAVERGSKLLFVVGHSSSFEINVKLKQEDNQYEDILQAQFEDAYYNLTLKSLAIVNWVADNCEKVKYVLKIDDDMFVNMQLLVDFAETREFKNVIIGKIAKKWLPHRDSNSKWYVPSSAYAGQVYPNFATGPAYLIHRDAIPNLVKVIRSNATKVIKLEDVFLAGIVAEKAGVRRLNYSLFKNAYFEVSKCNFMRFITSHQHSPKEILRLWQIVYADKKADCSLKKTPVTKAPAVKKEAQSKLVQKPAAANQSPIQIKQRIVEKDKKN